MRSELDRSGLFWATVTEGMFQLMNEKCLENFLVVVIIAFPDVLEEMFSTLSEMKPS